MPSPRSGLLRQIVSFTLPVLAAAALAFAAPSPAQISTRPAAVPNLHEPIAVYAADFNEDGSPDLVYIDRDGLGSTSLHVLLNDGHGNFTQSFASTGSFTSLAIGDMMGNGHVDIGYVVGDDKDIGGTGVTVHIDAGLGNGSFVSHQAVIQGIGHAADTFNFLAAGRLTLGGPLDLIGEDITSRTLFTFHANPTPAASGSGFAAGFTVHSGISLPDGPGAVSIADLNGDGHADLIVNGESGYAAGVFLGSATGIAAGASPASRFTGLTGIHSMLLQDVNHDGYIDLIAEGANGHIDVFAGDGDGSFRSTPSAQSGPLDETTGDNGHLISMANRTIDGKLFAITATQVGISELPGGGEQASFAVADFDGDGNPDLAVALGNTVPDRSSPASSLSVWFGSNDGKFPQSARRAVVPSLPNIGNISTLRSHAQPGLIPTSLGLFLCVDPPGSTFPCGNIAVTPPPLISPITMYYGQSVDGVAIESATNLTGTLSFLNGSTVFCLLNANTAQGTQTCPQTSGFFAAGTTTVTAVYSGDSVYASSISNPIVVTVFPDITTANVTSSLTPATFGQTVTFTANVQGNFATGSGQVIFLDGTTTLGTATLDPTGHATFANSTLTVGTHPIRVAFPGSANFNATTSATLNQVILPPTTPLQSIVALTSSLNPSAFGQSVTFTAAVTAPAAFPVAPTGTITFYDGPVNLGNSVVNPATGIATFSTSTLAIGSHAITASYSGASGNGTTVPPILASTSAMLTQVVVSPIPPSFTLAVSPSPITIGVGDTGILLVKVQAQGGFSQPVALTCSGLPRESSCSFILPSIPSGGGSTTLQLAVSAPHNCDSNTPYFISDNIVGTPSKFALSALFGGGILLAGFGRRRKLLVGTIFALLLSLGGLSLISGCGACTDLGTKPGVYSFTVVGTAQNGPSNEVEMQTIPLTVTIP